MDPQDKSGLVRINRALAQAGVASRRKSEELVRSGRVRVNGEVVRDLATQIDPVKDRLELDGKPLRLHTLEYYVYYKPRGEVSTLSDERKRPCTGDVCRTLPGMPRPVGRLDRRSEGLLLLTNDGDVAQRLAHPRHKVHKHYHASVKPCLRDAHARELTASVELEDGPAHFVSMQLLDQQRDTSRLLVIVDEGRNRLVRRMFEHFGYRVSLLRRVAMGPLKLGSLKPGEHRKLRDAEAADLRRQLGLKK